MVLEISSGKNLIDPVAVLKKVGLKEKMIVADLGCGTLGYYLFPAAKMVGSGGRVYAVDVQKHLLENLEKRARTENFSNIIGVWSNLERYGATNIPSGSVDAALLLNILFQCKDRSSVLKEATRLLKVGGKLLVTEWVSTSSPLGPPVEGRVDHNWVEQEADKLGLKLLSRFSPSQYHYGLIFEK